MDIKCTINIIIIIIIIIIITSVLDFVSPKCCCTFLTSKADGSKELFFYYQTLMNQVYIISNIKITETNPLALGSKTPIKSNINSSKSASILDLIRSFQDMVLLLYGK